MLKYYPLIFLILIFQEIKGNILEVKPAQFDWANENLVTSVTLTF